MKDIEETKEALYGGAVGGGKTAAYYVGLERRQILQKKRRDDVNSAVDTALKAGEHTVWGTIDKSIAALIEIREDLSEIDRERLDELMNLTEIIKRLDYARDDLSDIKRLIETK